MARLMTSGCLASDIKHLMLEKIEKKSKLNDENGAVANRRVGQVPERLDSSFDLNLNLEVCSQLS